MSNSKEAHPSGTHQRHVVCFGLNDLWIPNSFIHIDDIFSFFFFSMVDLLQGACLSKTASWRKNRKAINQSIISNSHPFFASLASRRTQRSLSADPPAGWPDGRREDSTAAASLANDATQRNATQQTPMAVTAPTKFRPCACLAQLSFCLASGPVPFLASFEGKLFTRRPVRDSVFGSVQQSRAERINIGCLGFFFWWLYTHTTMAVRHACNACVAANRPSLLRERGSGPKKRNKAKHTDNGRDASQTN